MRRGLLSLVLVLVALAAQASQTPLSTLRGPNDPSQMIATINQVIFAINGILSPLQPYNPSAVNFIALNPSITGNGPIIGLQSGSDTNTALGLQPAGNGNVLLFSGNQSSLGVLQFANDVSFFGAKGLNACPGAPPRAFAPPGDITGGDALGLGPGSIIKGYIAMQDWLGRYRYIPSC